VSRRIQFSILLLILVACGQKFEPDLSGWKANVVPARRFVELELNGREKRIELPGGPGTGYRYAQWTKGSEQILVAQTVTTDSCYNFKILAIDTTGAIVDTVYNAPASVAVNFKLAPNDTTMVLKTYHDNCVDGNDYKYSFYDRFTKRPVGDTIRVANARGIPFPETVWSPDSRKVILSRLYLREAKAFVYDLATKDTVRIDKGISFTWSPVDNDLVAYIKDYSLYSKNISTGESELIYDGRSDKEVRGFRWNPRGDFMMIHIRAYFMNVEAPMFQNNYVIYLSMKDRTESEKFHMVQKVDTWKQVPR
jgi:hypothetical protein